MYARLADIARQAEVSEATVSRVLNDRPGVEVRQPEAHVAGADVHAQDEHRHIHPSTSRARKSPHACNNKPAGYGRAPPRYSRWPSTRDAESIRAVEIRHGGRKCLIGSQRSGEGARDQIFQHHVLDTSHEDIFSCKRPCARCARTVLRPTMLAYRILDIDWRGRTIDGLLGPHLFAVCARSAGRIVCALVLQLCRSIPTSRKHSFACSRMAPPEAVGLRHLGPSL